MCQASTCGRVLARARVQVLQNSGSRMVVLRFTTLSARDRHWRNPRKKNYREHSNIKSARVSALTGSMPRKMADARQSGSALIRNRTHMSPHSLRQCTVRLTLTTQPLVFINCTEKNFVFRHLQLIFLCTGLSYSDFSSWISRPDTKYEKFWTQTFNWKI